MIKELQDGKNPDKLNDPNLMVICACSQGEYALRSENLGAGRSAFGYFFERALTAPEADTNRDNVIDVQEYKNTWPETSMIGHCGTGASTRCPTWPARRTTTSP